MTDTSVIALRRVMDHRVCIHYEHYCHKMEWNHVGRVPSSRDSNVSACTFHPSRKILVSRSTRRDFRLMPFGFSPTLTDNRDAPPSRRVIQLDRNGRESEGPPENKPLRIINRPAYSRRQHADRMRVLFCCRLVRTRCGATLR